MMFGGVVAAHPATDSDASIARLAIFIVDLKLDVCVAPRRSGFRTLRANALEGAVSAVVSGRSYMRCVLAASRGLRNDGRKAAGNNARQVGTINRHGMRRRAMDFAAFVAGILGTVIVL